MNLLVRYTRILCLSILSLTFSVGAIASAGDDFVEPGRFGVIVSETNDATQAGGIYVSDKFEASLTTDGSFIDRKSSSPGIQQTGDMGLTAKIGKRFNIGTYNYLSAGLLWNESFFGRDDGVSTEGSRNIAPYVGVQRHFSGTNLMLSVYLQPVTYSHQFQNDGNGKQIQVNTWQFFQCGGIGIAYLF